MSYIASNQPPATVDVIAVVISDFTPRGPAELELRLGDIVKVTKQGPTRWIGSANGKVGSFPSECVEIKSSISQIPSSTSIPPRSSGSGRGRGRGLGQSTGAAPVGRYSSYTPPLDPTIAPAPSQGIIPPRAKSNYIPSDSASNLHTGPGSSVRGPLTPPPMLSSTSGTPAGQIHKPPPPSGGTKFPAPMQLPPPPPSLVVRAPPGGGAPLPHPPPPQSTAKSSLPKFSQISLDDDDPLPPPRSPPRGLRRGDLPDLPPRDYDDHAPSQTPPSGGAPADVPSSAPPEPKKRSKEDLRQACLQEIYQTEKDYIVDLENIISVFIMPLRLLAIVPEQMLYNIFSNVEVLINCNKEMLKELEEQMDGNKTGVDIRIGGVFKKLADYFKMYKVYSANQQNSLTTVDTLLKKNPDFKKKLDICHSDPRCRGLFLQSFLIKPIQRVCKYPLLLRELISHTPEDHPDFADLQLAFTKINEVVASINEHQRLAEGLQRILDLQSLVDGIDTLVAPGRNLQKEADLNFWKSAKSKHPEKRHVFFFSDMIMLTTKKGDRKFEYRLSFPFDTCTITVLDSSIIKHSFELATQQKKNSVQRCILSCETVEEAHQWIRDIKWLMKDYQKRKMNEMRQMKNVTLAA